MLTVKNKYKSKNQVAIFSGVLLVILFSSIIFFLKKDKSESAEISDIKGAYNFKTQSRKLTNEKYKLSYEVPSLATEVESLKNSSSSSSDKYYVDYLFEGEINNNSIYGPISITISVENGLRTPSAISKISPLELVLNGLNKKNSIDYEGYVKISESKFFVEGKQAARYVFSYDGKNGIGANQRFYIIELSPDSVLYVRTQTLTNLYEKTATDIILPLEQSLRLEP